MANGTYSNTELIESLLIDLNKLQKLLVDGQFIAYCDLVAKMGQKLGLLRKGVQNDLDNRDKVIEQLKNHIRDLGEEVEDMSAEEFVERAKEGKL